MKVKYWSPNKRLCLEAEGDVKEIFKQLALFEEVFCRSTNHKNEKSDELSFSVREHDGNDFFEIKDEDGWAFGFGQTKVGQKLFPRKKDANGEWLPDNGWSKYDPNAPKVKSNSNGF